METITIISWITGFSVAIISLIYAVRHFCILKTTSYIERLNTPEMAKYRSEINEWLKKDNSEITKYSLIKENPQLESQLKIFFDVFTELGIAYKFRAVSRKMTKEIFFPFIPKYWKKLQFYIYLEQLNGEKVGYWFGYLAEEINAFQNKNNKRIDIRYKLPNNYYSITNETEMSIEELKTELTKFKQIENNKQNANNV